MRDTFRVGCEVFVIKNNQLLLGKRKNCHGAGSWGLPGGHLDKGEKLVDAAKREIKEELGIDNAELSLAAITDNLLEIQYISVSFKLENFNGHYKLMEPDKCEEWRFFPLSKLPDNIYSYHQRIIKTFTEGKVYLC